MAMDPNLRYVLGTPLSVDFTPPAPPPPAPPAKPDVVPAAGTPGPDGFTYPFTIPAHDPAAVVVPVHIACVMVPTADVPAGADAAFFLDDSKGFPTGIAAVPIPDPSQPTEIVVSIPPVSLSAPQTMQPIYAYPVG